MKAHHHVLEQNTGRSIALKDTTDDRLGDLMSALGEEERGYQFQQELGQHLIRAYELLTKIGRYDTNTLFANHAPRPMSPDPLL